MNKPTEFPTVPSRPRSLPIRERAAISVQLAAEFSGISRTRIYELLNDKTIEGRTVRGRRLVLVRSLVKFVEGDCGADTEAAR
jgi:hypothetical protein